MFQPPRLTNAGKALYNRTLAGEGIQFTKIKLGKGTLTDPIATMTALVDLVTEIDVSVFHASDNSYVDISGSFSNAGMQDGFYWREIGLFAANPEAPEERERDILYCYQNAYDTADFIPAASVEIVEKHIAIPVIVADTENVSCLIDHSLIFVTRDELKKIIDERTEMDVSETYMAWEAKNQGHSVSDFAQTLTDGTYRIDDGYSAYHIRHITASGIVFTWVEEYTDEGYYHATLYRDGEVIVRLSTEPGDEGVSINGVDLATKIYVDNQISGAIGAAY